MKTLTWFGRLVLFLCSVRASPDKRDPSLHPEPPSRTQRVYGTEEANRVQKLMPQNLLKSLVVIARVSLGQQLLFTTPWRTLLHFNLDYLYPTYKSSHLFLRKHCLGLKELSVILWSKSLFFLFPEVMTPLKKIEDPEGESK